MREQLGVNVTTPLTVLATTANALKVLMEIHILKMGVKVIK